MYIIYVYNVEHLSLSFTCHEEEDTCLRLIYTTVEHLSLSFTYLVPMFRQFFTATAVFSRP